MSTGDQNKRADELTANAQECISKGDLSTASKRAKEAISVVPNHAGALAILQSLQKGETESGFFKACKAYINNGNEEDGKEALRALQSNQSTMSDHDAQQSMRLLLEYRKPPGPFLDEITATLLVASSSARKAVAQKFGPQPTETFDNLWRRGQRTFATLLNVLLDKAMWPTAKDQSQATKDAFQLSLGAMLDAGQEHQEVPMAMIARLLAADPEDLRDLLDLDVFVIILSSLDIRLPASQRSQATLATIKLLEVTKEEGEQQLKNFVAAKVTRKHNDDLIVGFSAAAAAFPIVPAIAAQLFLTEGFLQGLIPVLERNNSETDERKSHKLEHAALELFSAACIDKGCREAISKYCASWLGDVAEASRDAESSGLAALVLAKISRVKQESDQSQVLDASTDVAHLSSILTNMVLVSDGSSQKQSSLEGLAYTSLDPRVKEDIAANPKLLAKLVSVLKDQGIASATAYGALNIFAHITAYLPPRTEEEKRMSQLKAYANTAKPQPDDPLDDDKHVTDRCRKVLDAGLVPALLARSKNGTLTVVMLITQIINSLAKEQKHRGLMAQQSAIKLCLQCLDSLDKQEQATVQVKSIPAHALARILISVNPTHVFSSGLPAVSSLRPLVGLLKQDPAAEQRDLLPTFEALLALTNLASTEDNSLRDVIIRLAWTEIEDLLLANNALVQRASVELVCNLMVSPSGVAKFADGSKQAGNRMHILLALADVDDLATRKAAGGALAMLTEWDAAVEAVLSKERGVKILLGMCEDDSDEMRHRGVACLLNLVSAPGDTGIKGSERVKGEGGVEVLKASLQKSRDPQVLQLGLEVLKKLTGK